MNKIRVNSGIEIEVNNNGETIVVNADNQGFVENFFALQEELEAISEDTKHAGLDDMEPRSQLQYSIEKTKDIMSGIDALFGENACKKVFGDIIPNPYLIADFFEQLTPIAEKYMNARQKRISEKYSKRRKGGRNKYRTKDEIIQDAMR